MPQDLERIFILRLLNECNHLALESIHIPWGLLQDCSREELISTWYPSADSAAGSSYTYWHLLASQPWHAARR